MTKKGNNPQSVSAKRFLIWREFKRLEEEHGKTPTIRQLAKCCQISYVEAQKQLISLGLHRSKSAARRENVEESGEYKSLESSWRPPVDALMSGGHIRATEAPIQSAVD